MKVKADETINAVISSKKEAHTPKQRRQTEKKCNGTKRKFEKKGVKKNSRKKGATERENLTSLFSIQKYSKKGGGGNPLQNDCQV